MTVELSHGIRLLSGTLFNYHAPHEAEVEIGDIAAALSKVCRFAGHLPYFYSVAQHAVNASYIVPEEHAFTALMHDTAEAFTNDLPTPLKEAVPMFKDLEVKIEAAMAARFGFQYPLPWAVKLADLQMLGLEKVHIKRDFSYWSILDGIEFMGLHSHARRAYYPGELWLGSLTPEDAETIFLERYEELRPR